jgi:hypothetical protein
MIDRDWHPWIIEVNTNPCLALSSSYLARLIPEMLENSLRLTIDCLYPEPIGSPKKAVASVVDTTLPLNKFQLIFASEKDEEKLSTRMGLEGWTKFCEETSKVIESNVKSEPATACDNITAPDGC